jgi:predicted dehydrogenase
MRKLRIALVGCGRIGNRHAEHISNYCELIAVCDIEKDKANSLSENYSVKAYYDIETMLSENKDEFDVVSICTPNGLHCEHSILALKHGFNVLCEKPMALSIEDSNRMIIQAEKSNKRLFNVKQNRFNPPVAKLKELIDDGVLGKIYNVQLTCFWNRNTDYYKNSWKGTLDLDGGTLYTQFSHFIDLLYWIVGDVKHLNAIGKNFNHESEIEFEDSGVVSLEFNNGALGTINYSVNSFNQNMEGSITLICEKGSVKIGGQYLNILEYSNIEDHIIEELPKGNKPNNYGKYTGSMSNHDKIYMNLIDVFENNRPIQTSAFEGGKTVEIISRIYDQIRGN